MGYIVFNGLLLAYLIWDGYKREVSNLWAWGLGTILMGVLVLPFYFAKRPLTDGEVRTGGFSWNVLKNFVILWTLLIVVLGIGYGARVSETFQTAQSDAEQAGAVIGTGLGFGILGFMWLFPLIGAGVLGLFLKKDVNEEGPTGPLANEDESS